MPSEPVRQLLIRLKNVNQNSQGWTARCPAHEDNRNSLSIAEGADGRALLKCFARCTVENVCAALQLTLGDLYPHSGSAHQQRRIVAEYSYTDEVGELLYQNVRYEPKDFRQCRPDGKGGWVWNLNGVRRVLYRLPELLHATEVLVVEGERDADTGKNLGFTSTTSGAVGSWREEFSEKLRCKKIVIIADADGPGRKFAQQVAASLAGKVETLKVLEFPGAKDLSEWVERGGSREALLKLIEGSPEWAPHVIDAAALLDDIFAFIRRFMILTVFQARIITLWILHTHAFAAADATPYLAITSREKQSGKTRVLEICELLVPNAWMTGRVTAAVLIRKIDAEQPTLLLDESDAAFKSGEEYAEALRGVLNTGHRRGGKASCCVGQGASISFKDFATFCPKAIAGIGKLLETVADRSIPIRLKRAARSERKQIKRFRRRDVEAEAAALRGRMEAWSVPAIERLRDARPWLPDEISDRQQDGAEPLLAIADAAGGDWADGARQALIELCAEAQASDESIGVRLLTDVRNIFRDRALDRIASADLASALADIETAPWGEWGKSGKPLSAPKLARLLSPFTIVPHTVRIGGKTPKGYEEADFTDGFERYLPAIDAPVFPSTAFQNATTPQANSDAISDGFSTYTAKAALHDEKREVANYSAPRGVVAFSNSPTRGEEEEVLDRKPWTGPVPKPVECAVCGEIQPSALALARHLHSHAVPARAASGDEPPLG